MKKTLAILLLAVMAIMPANVSAGIINVEAMKQGVLNYLKAEGFQPYIDENDNSVTFKKEGILYWVTFTAWGDDAYYMRFHRSSLDYDFDTDRSYMLEAINQLHRNYKAVRCSATNSSISIEMDQFIMGISDFKTLWEDYVSILNDAHAKLKEYYAEYDEMGFCATKIAVANTTKDNVIIDDYGDDIRAARSRYLRPKLSVYSPKRQTVTFYIKLLDENNNLQSGTGSPAGYSYKYTVTLEPGNNNCQLLGWGNDTDGRWPAGDYTFKIYYNDEYVKGVEFTVK